jgi:hypothetical protein
MDDFRVGSISPYDPDRRPDPSGAVKRRREKRAADQELETEDIITTSEAPEAEATEEPIKDYYEPSGPAEESEP